ncbi:hypothetical protein BIT28_07420 [Photobacterium proteolyticum]|uniref:HTH cro/C1-type domain-containing protein n=1 Tax=Photobacterium proteolyticum TaxID=1903952 RepID=A0A1Q9H7I2_9GAMM|nr:hypothetical protein [Photobacterium proteolyticum]OLQ83792.1 hypothetical protein BIT28_07420 [Photobacterium proteolyticum]
MDELVEDYETNQVLIDLLFPVIERYEEEVGRFQEFNEHMDSVDQGVAMLSVIIDQNKLKLCELPEIGGKSLVSQILNGNRSLTLKHITALSDRFGIPEEMFIANQRDLVLYDQTFDAFEQELNAVPDANEGMNDLLNRKSPWEGWWLLVRKTRTVFCELTFKK